MVFWTILKYHSQYYCQIPLQVMLLPIKRGSSSLAVRRCRRWHGEELISVAQVRGQFDRCLKSPVANVTGVGRFSICRCFIQSAHSLVRPQVYISSSDGIGSASRHLPPGHAIFGLFVGVVEFWPVSFLLLTEVRFLYDCHTLHDPLFFCRLSRW